MVLYYNNKVIQRLRVALTRPVEDLIICVAMTAQVIYICDYVLPQCQRKQTIPRYFNSRKLNKMCTFTNQQNNNFLHLIYVRRCVYEKLNGKKIITTIA